MRNNGGKLLDENFIDIYKVPDRFDDNIRWGTKQQLIYAKLKDTNQLGKGSKTQGKFGLFSYRTFDNASSLGMAASGNSKLPLNYIYTNNLSDAVLDTSNNRVLLGPGHYIVKAYMNSCATNNTLLKIVTSSASTMIPGIATFADTTNNDCAPNYAVGYLNLQQSDGIELILYTTNFNSLDGVGRTPNGYGYSLNYVFLEIWEL